MVGEDVYSQHEIHLPRVQIHYDRKEKKDSFAISFTEITKVNGQWGIIVRDQKGKLIDVCSTIFSKDAAYSCKLPVLEEGKYTVSFLFNGTFDKMYSFADYGFIQNGLLRVNDKKSKGTLQLQKPENSPSGDKISNLIKNANKEKSSKKEEYNNWYMAIMFVLVLVILLLLHWRVRIFINNRFSV
jgi:hypothetical protein